ncbi:hypothetical protein, partial [Escherichia marmotae]|uniref:hypothetical protein n=1 Tax=Escherichia marmotae TaxID=1499973 RepID=UPI00215ACE30
GENRDGRPWFEPMVYGVAERQEEIQPRRTGNQRKADADGEGKLQVERHEENSDALACDSQPTQADQRRQPQPPRQ